MSFFYVYVLKSIQKDFVYVGYTTNLRKRLEKHNGCEVLSTKFYAPLRLIFFEGHLSMTDAKRREKYLKTTKGKVALRLMLNETLKLS